MKSNEQMLANNCVNGVTNRELESGEREGGVRGLPSLTWPSLRRTGDAERLRDL